METINKKILALIDTVYESGYKINFRDYRELSNAAVYNDCPLTQDKLKTIEHTLNNIYLFKQDSEEMVYAYLSDIVDLIEQKYEILYNINMVNQLEDYCEKK